MKSVQGCKPTEDVQGQLYLVGCSTRLCLTIQIEEVLFDDP
jgi:hypothetical protein